MARVCTVSHSVSRNLSVESAAADRIHATVCECCVSRCTVSVPLPQCTSSHTQGSVLQCIPLLNLSVPLYTAVLRCTPGPPYHTLQHVLSCHTSGTIRVEHLSCGDPAHLSCATATSSPHHPRLRPWTCQPHQHHAAAQTHTLNTHAHFSCYLCSSAFLSSPPSRCVLHCVGRRAGNHPRCVQSFDQAPRHHNLCRQSDAAENHRQRTQDPPRCRSGQSTHPRRPRQTRTSHASRSCSRPHSRRHRAGWAVIPTSDYKANRGQSRRLHLSHSASAPH
jgi:hypothetical protein